VRSLLRLPDVRPFSRRGGAATDGGKTTAALLLKPPGGGFFGGGPVLVRPGHRPSFYDLWFREESVRPLG